MSVANNIAEQLHHTKPDHLEPKIDVGMTQMPDDAGVVVSILARPRPGHDLDGYGRRVEIVYDEGRDIYDLWIREQKPGERKTVRHLEGMFADQLGELVWGEEAKPYEMPMFELLEWKEDETMDEALRRHKVL